MLKPASRKHIVTAAYTLHNTLKLLRGGKEYFDLLERMIETACHSIHIQFYIFDEDETGQRIALALKEAASRNVKVYLLVDGYASGLSNQFIHDLKQAGIHFRRFEPLLKSKRFYFGRRLHHKVVVVDETYSLVSGLNVSNRYNDMPDARAWLDWAIFSEGPVAIQLARICIRRYKGKHAPIEHAKPGPLKLDHVIRNCAARVRINDWVGRKREISNSYLDLFRMAKRDITLMSPYFLPGHDFKKKLRTALRRGVKVRVIQAGISDILLSKYAERYMYGWLLKNKVELYEYQKTILHGKIGVSDNHIVTIGSYNLNNLSAYASIELNIDVHNHAFAKNVSMNLDDIIKNDCKQITEESFQRSFNWMSRILHRMCYDFLRATLYLFTFYYRQKE